MGERRWLWLTGALTALGGLCAAWLVFGQSQPAPARARPGVAADPRGEKPPGATPGAGASKAPRAPLVGASAVASVLEVAPVALAPVAPVAPEDLDVERARQALLPDLQTCVAQRRAKGARALGDLDLGFLLVRRSGYGRARAPSVLADGIGEGALSRCALEQITDADFSVRGDGGDLALRMRLHGGEAGVTLQVLGTAAPEDVSEVAASPETTDTSMADGAAEASPVADAGTEGSP